MIFWLIAPEPCLDQDLPDLCALQALATGEFQQSCLTAYGFLFSGSHFSGRQLHLIFILSLGWFQDFGKFKEKGNFPLPSHAQWLLAACHTRPDFFYEQEHAAIYIDGPHHLYPERQQRDQAQTDCMENAGYSVIRFGLLEDWEKIVKRYPNLFGSKVV